MSSNTATFGGEGGTPFRKSCPGDAYLSKMTGATGENVYQICGTCSDGTNLGCYGGVGFPDQTPYTITFDQPVRSFYGSSNGKYVNNIGGIGQKTGVATEVFCPDGSYINGLNGKSGSWIDNIGFTCSAVKPTSSPIVYTPPPALTPTMPVVVQDTSTTAPGLVYPPPTVQVAAQVSTSTPGASIAPSASTTTATSTITTSNIFLYILLFVVAVLLGAVVYTNYGNRSNPYNQPNRGP